MCDANLAGAQVMNINRPSGSLIVVLLGVLLACPEPTANAQEPPSWHLLGNGGINPANNFVGTTDSQPLVIKTNGIERLRVNVPAQVSGGTSETLVVSGNS